MSVNREFLPRTPVISAVTWIAAALVFAALVVGWSAAPPSTASVALASQPVAGEPMAFPRTAALERGWVEPAFREQFLTRPVAGTPCVDDLAMSPAVRTALAGALAIDSNEQLSQVHQRFGDTWLPGLLLGQRLLGQGDSARALDVLTNVYGRARIQSLMGRVVDAARRGDPRRAPTTAETLAVIHLLQAYGVAQIETRRTVGEDYWRALKNPIGAVKVLSARGVTGTVVDAPNHDEHRLPAPGCPPPGRNRDTHDTLTSLDLYNNLIVGYLEAGSFVETDARRQAEFKRTYDDPAHENPLQQVLRAAVSQRMPDDEHWVWALSNAERLLRDRRFSQFGAFANPYLALTLVQLVGQANTLELAPMAQGALQRERASLVESALAHRSTVDERRRPAFDQALARASLLVAATMSRPLSLPTDVLANLGDEPRSVADAVSAALAVRVDPDRRIAAATAASDQAAAMLGPANEELGRRRDPWLAALRSDVAGHVASGAWAREDPDGAARLARRLLRPGDPRPQALDTLSSSLGFGARARLWWAGWRGVGRWLLAAAAGLLVWIVGRWWGGQWRLRQSLFTSFYRREAQARLRR